MARLYGPTIAIISTIHEETEMRDVIAVSNFIIANILLSSLDLDLSLIVRSVVSVGKREKCTSPL